MFSYIEYTEVPGAKKSHDVEVYALSTCGFCKRALAFLRDNDIQHRYIHLDLISIETKNRVKDELKAAYGTHVSFPYAVIDKKFILVGFIESEWHNTLV